MIKVSRLPRACNENTIYFAIVNDNNQRTVLLMLKAERTTRDVTEKLTSSVTDDDDNQFNFETHQSPKFKSIMVIVS